jgi:uncharacterized protein (TIGR02145 family)
LENGNALAGTNQATYDVPTNKAAGVYTYVRQSKSAECPDWQSSNEFTVTVFACSFTAGTATGSTATFTDARDGKQYKTVVMPDGRTWFAQNLNYTKDLTFNMYATQANGKQYTDPMAENGSPAIGSYWCPGAEMTTYEGDPNTCNIYGAFYTWETAMMVDGKYADESRTSSAWDESWISPYYYNASILSDMTPNADKNNARGKIVAKDGGRGICPMGWHMPTSREWSELLDKVDGDGTGTVFINQTGVGYIGTDAGIKLRSTGTYTGTDPGDGSWQINPGLVGTDNYGFSALPAGNRSRVDAAYTQRGIRAAFLSSSAYGLSGMLIREIYFTSSGVQRYVGDRRRGLSVRCIADN